VANQHQLARAGADRIDGHHLPAGFLAFGVHVLDEHELQAVQARFLARGDDSADNFAKIHKQKTPGKTAGRRVGANDQPSTE